jgi:hypothetical protein
MTSVISREVYPVTEPLVIVATIVAKPGQEELVE